MNEHDYHSLEADVTKNRNLNFKYRTHLKFDQSNKIQWQMRTEWTYYWMQESKEQQGLLQYLQVKIKMNKSLTGEIRGTFFYIPNYNERIYAMERDAQ